MGVIDLKVIGVVCRLVEESMQRRRAGEKDEANVGNKATCRKAIRNVTQRFGAHKWVHDLG